MPWPFRTRDRPTAGIAPDDDDTLVVSDRGSSFADSDGSDDNDDIDHVERSAELAQADVHPPAEQAWRSQTSPLSTTLVLHLSAVSATDAFTAQLTSRRPMVTLHTSTPDTRSGEAPHGLVAATVVSAGDRPTGDSSHDDDNDDRSTNPDTSGAPFGTPSALPVLEHRRAVAVPAAARSGDESGRVGDDTRVDLEDLPRAPIVTVTGAPGHDASRVRDDVNATATALVDDAMASTQLDQPRQRRTLADSRRLGLGPAYRGSLPEAMRAEHARHHEIADPVDPSVRAIVHAATDVDPGERLVHRGPSVTAEARERGALAFARDGEIHVSADAGRLDTAAGRALVAHELTHTVQQRAAPTTEESTPAGLAQEAQARRVEQYVRGDADATLPVAPMIHRTPAAAGDEWSDDAVAEAHTLMRELVAAGLADEDGEGGITITRTDARHTGDPAQRSVGAPPTARSGAATEPGEATREQNWNPLDTLGHNLASSFSHDMLGLAGSLAGFSDEFAAEQTEVLDEGDREFARNQTQQAFRTLRLEHRTSARLTELNREHTGDDRPALEELPAEELHRIREAVAADVSLRMERLAAENALAIEQLNDERAAGTAPVREVPPRDYDTAFHLLFDDPDQTDPPSEETVLAALRHSARRSPGAGTPPSAAPHAGPTPASTAAASTTSTTAPSTATTSPTTSPASTAHGSTPTPATTHGPASHGPGAPTTTPGSHHDDEVWHADRDATVGTNLHTAAISAGFDVVGGMADLGASLFGFSADTREEVFGSIDHDRTAALERARHPGAAGEASTDAATSTATSPPATPTSATSTGESGVSPSSATATPRTPIGGHSEAERRTTATGAEALSLDHIDLAELALRLYPDISSRLRHELLLDRERAGLLADFR